MGDLASAGAKTAVARGTNKALSGTGATQDRTTSASGAGPSTAGKGNFVSVKVDPKVSPTAGLSQRPLPAVRVGTSPAPPDVRAAAAGAMAADPRRGSGVGGEAAAMETRKGEGAGFDLNALKGKGGNFPALDFSTPGGFYSAKTKSVGTALSDTSIKSYLNDLDTMRDKGGPGFAQTTAQKAAALVWRNRGAIQQKNAWPAGLAQDATEDQILHHIAQHGRLVIPDDHVEPVRQAMTTEAVRNPGRWPGEDIGRLQQRVQPMGITSTELDQLHRAGQ